MCTNGKWLKHAWLIWFSKFRFWLFSKFALFRWCWNYCHHPRTEKRNARELSVLVSKTWTRGTRRFCVLLSGRMRQPWRQGRQLTRFPSLCNFNLLLQWLKWWRAVCWGWQGLPLATSQEYWQPPTTRVKSFTAAPFLSPAHRTFCAWLRNTTGS